jgi:hypothetical protein
MSLFGLLNDVFSILVEFYYRRVKLKGVAEKNTKNLLSRPPPKYETCFQLDRNFPCLQPDVVAVSTEMPSVVLSRYIFALPHRASV